MTYLFFLMLLADIGLSFALSLMSYLPVNRPILFWGLFAVLSLLTAILAVRKKPQHRKLIQTSFFAALILISLAFGINTYRYHALNRSYLEHDTPFNAAAREVMPELSDFSDAEEIEHYHGNKYGEEWVVLKVSFTSEAFNRCLSEIEITSSFYAPGTIMDAPFAYCEHPFTIGQYHFQILNLPEYRKNPFSNHAAAIGTNEADCSIIYLFISSDVSSSMGPDGVIRGIWRYIGVSS